MFIYQNYIHVIYIHVLTPCSYITDSYWLPSLGSGLHLYMIHYHKRALSPGPESHYHTDKHYPVEAVLRLIEAIGDRAPSCGNNSRRDISYRRVLNQDNRLPCSPFWESTYMNKIYGTPVTCYITLSKTWTTLYKINTGTQTPKTGSLKYQNTLGHETFQVSLPKKGYF